MTYREGIVAAARSAGRAALDSMFAVLFVNKEKAALPIEARLSRNNRGPIDQRSINWEGEGLLASELGSMDSLDELSLCTCQGQATALLLPDSSLKVTWDLVTQTAGGELINY